MPDAIGLSGQSRRVWGLRVAGLLLACLLGDLGVGLVLSLQALGPSAGLQVFSTHHNLTPHPKYLWPKFPIWPVSRPSRDINAP